MPTIKKAEKVFKAVKRDGQEESRSKPFKRYGRSAVEITRGKWWIGLREIGACTAV